MAEEFTMDQVAALREIEKAHIRRGFKGFRSYFQEIIDRLKVKPGEPEYALGLSEREQGQPELAAFLQQLRATPPDQDVTVGRLSGRWSMGHSTLRYDPSIRLVTCWECRGVLGPAQLEAGAWCTTCGGNNPTGRVVIYANWEVLK